MAKEIKFTLTERTIKIRRNSIIFSGLSLFMGLTGYIPSKFTLIDISFNDYEYTLVFFIFFITLYHFLYFLSSALPEILEIYEPHRREKLKKTTVGDTLGLGVKELDENYDEEQEYRENERLKGTEEGEKREIDEKIKHKINNSKLNYIYKLKWIKLLILEVILPSIIGFWGLIALGIRIYA